MGEIRHETKPEKPRIDNRMYESLRHCHTSRRGVDFG